MPAGLISNLSKVLSDGLAALDDRSIADVAACFEDLEAVQRDLRRLQEAHGTVKVFLPAYRRYLRAVASARATAAAEAERALRSARRRVTDAEKAPGEADQEVERLRRDRLACDGRREVADQRHRAVLESPAYRDAKSLVEIDGRATDAERGLAQADGRPTSADDEAEKAAGELATADAEITETSTAVDRGFTEACEAADLAGVAWAVTRGEVESTDLPHAVRSLGVRRWQDIADVRAALATAEAASVARRVHRCRGRPFCGSRRPAVAARQTAGLALDAARAELATT